MEKRLLFVRLFLISILFISGCEDFKIYREAEDSGQESEDYFEESLDSSEYDEIVDGFPEEEISDDLNGNEEQGASGERTQEEIFEETGCEVDLAVDKIFELVEQGASDEEVLITMCEMNCEELNPEEYICP